MNEAPHPRVAGGGKHSPGACHVHSRERLRALLDDNADQMNEGVGAAGEPGQGRGVGEATTY